jgi:hypothetical protein
VHRLCPPLLCRSFGSVQFLFGFCLGSWATWASGFIINSSQRRYVMYACIACMHAHICKCSLMRSTCALQQPSLLEKAQRKRVIRDTTEHACLKVPAKKECTSLTYRCGVKELQTLYREQSWCVCLVRSHVHTRSRTAYHNMHTHACSSLMYTCTRESSLCT